MVIIGVFKIIEQLRLHLNNAFIPIPASEPIYTELVFNSPSPTQPRDPVVMDTPVYNWMGITHRAHRQDLGSDSDYFSSSTLQRYEMSSNAKGRAKFGSKAIQYLP